MDEKDEKLELYKSILSTSQQAVNYCFLLNGGAIIAIITFLGNYKGTTVDANPMATSIKIFVFGLISAATSSILLYITQYSYFRVALTGSRPFFFSGTTYRIVVLILLICSIVLFAFGSIYAGSALGSGSKVKAALLLGFDL